MNSRPITAQEEGCLEEPLTPNHLLTMKSRVVLSPPGSFENVEVYSRRRWRRVQALAEQFWGRFRSEYLQGLQGRAKWRKPVANVEVGDVVLVKDEGAPRNRWPMARVEEVFPGSDRLVRRVKLCVGSSKGEGMDGDVTQSHLERPIHKLVKLCSG